MDWLKHDLRFAFRTFRKQPGFLVAAVLSLGLGIGANTTIFTWVNATLLHPLPGVPDQDRLLVLVSLDRKNHVLSLSYPDFADIRDRARSFQAVADEELAMSLLVGDRAEHIWGEVVSGNYFDVVGVTPILGRGFLPEESASPGAHPVMVISHGLWQRAFAGDPAVVGRTVRLNASDFTIVGVAPAGFRGTVMGLGLDAWVPLMMADRVVEGGGRRLTQRGNHWLGGLVRLRPGVEPSAAQAELESLSGQLGREYPDSNDGVDNQLYPLWASPSGGPRVLRPILLALAGIVALVLLIACANVANLLLARATGRVRELAIRRSLGASRGRIARQLFAEGVVLALLGGLAGLALAAWTAGLLRAFVPATSLPVSLSLSIDGRVLVFAVAVSMLTTVVFGLVPAVQGSRSDLNSALKEGAPSLLGGGRGRLRQALVVAQVSLSLVLLVAAGLLVRSLRNAHGFNPGFNPRNVLLAEVDLFPSGYDAGGGRAFIAESLRRLRALPGVESVTVARRAPMGFSGRSSTSLTVEGYTPPPKQPAWAQFDRVGPAYLATMQIPLVAGRDLRFTDDAAAPRVALVNETMAERYWKDGEAVGRRLRLGQEWVRVVGIARNSRHYSLNEGALPFLYLPVLQWYRGDLTFHVRTAASPARLAAAVRGAIHAVDPELPIFAVRTLRDHVAAASFQQDLGSKTLGVFGVLALLLAALGLYGVMSFVVGRRVREIGIRVALGGTRGHIVRLMAARGLTLTGLGIALGLPLGWAVARLMSRLLFGVNPGDPLTFGLVALALVTVGGLASAVPTRRAARVDPATALRCE